MLALWAPAASATFHLMQIREIYPGTLASPNSEYVELQMWAAGQNHVGGHVLHTYDAAGVETSRDTFAQDLSGEANQSTMVLATPEAEAQLGFRADAAIVPLTPLPAGALNPAGGAVCWEEIDCVSWGSFAGPVHSTPTGSPAAPGGIPDGMALRRTIAAGCPTLLEPTDDTDNSAADFLPVFPGPRPNSVAPSEHPCEAEKAKPGHGSPQTKLRKLPPKKSHDRTPTFRFTASESGSAFECALDRRRFRLCRSPLTTKPLSVGRHMFKVRALNSSGVHDPSPAAYAFRILPKRQP